MNLTKVARVPLNILVPSIRNDLLLNQDFTKSLKMKVDKSVHFPIIKISFDRQPIIGGVQKIYSGSKLTSIQDSNSENWTLKLNPTITNPDKNSRLILESEKGSVIPLYNFEPLSKIKKIRIEYFENLIKNGYYSKNFQEKWYKILIKRHFTDTEHEQFIGEISNSPQMQVQKLTELIATGSFKIPEIIPNSREYYELLVGQFDGSSSISEYAENGAKNHINELINWNPEKGLTQALHLSYHPATLSQISLNHINSKQVESVLNNLIESNDRVSQLGAVQVGLHFLSQNPKLELPLIELIEQLKSEQVENDKEGYEFLNLLFILTEGELARTRCLAGFPPYYRRLASFAHASQLTNVFSNSNVDSSKLSKHIAKLKRFQLFHYQTLIDSKIDPRWSSDYSFPLAIREYFLDLILKFAKDMDFSKMSPLIKKLFSDDKVFSISAVKKIPPYYFPEPISGKEICSNSLPPKLKSIMKTNFNEIKDLEDTLRYLLGLVTLFSNNEFNSKIENLILSRYIYPLKYVSNETELGDVIKNLARVSAIIESEKLSYHVKGICQQYRYIGSFNLNIIDELHCCVVTASSFSSDLNRWRFIANWVTELSFSKLEAADAEMLNSGLKCLCFLEPGLEKYCGQAEVASSSLISLTYSPSNWGR